MASKFKLADKTIKKIRSYFSKEWEGRMPELYDVNTGSAKFAGINSFDWGDPASMRGLRDYLRIDNELMTRYRDYEEMDHYPEIAAALDIYSDDATVIDSHTGKCFAVEAEDQKLQKELESFYYHNLKVEEDAWGTARTLCKYGNAFSEHIIKEKEGVIGYNHLQTPATRRIESSKGGLLGFLYDLNHKFNANYGALGNANSMSAASMPYGSESYFADKEDETSQMFDHYEAVHFRLKAQHRNSVYGMAITENARWIFRRLALLEDAAMIYKLMRAPARYAFYIDVGDLPPKQALAHVNQVRQRYKKYKFINPTTQKLDFRLNPLGNIDDFFVPVRQGKRASEIDVISGPDYSNIEDLEYFQRKLFAALKVPKIFLNFDEGMSERNTVSAEDVRFARSVLRVQRELRNGYKRSGNIHLIVRGIDPAAVDYEVYMTTPSSIFEMAQIEVQNARADLASRMQEHTSMEWILTNVYGLAGEEIKNIFKQQLDDRLRESKAELESRKLEMEMEAQFESADQIQIPGVEKEVRLSKKPVGLSHPVMDELSIRRMSKQAEQFSRQLQETNKNEKRLDDKLGQILRNDRVLSNKLKETKAFLNEISNSVKRKAS